LKAHFPTEFMAALMTTEMDNTDKITKYIADARQHQLPILPPDVNFSQKRFSVEWLQSPAGKPMKGIRFGLEAIKGVGGIAVDTILEARKAGQFLSALDFCRRVSTRKANKKVLESLCLAGALDSIAEVNRASLFVSLEALLDHAGDEQEEKELGQSSLFDAFSSDEIKLMTPIGALFKQEADWPSSKKLSLEKEVVGFYISGHPMDTWQKICEQWLGWSTEKLRIVAAEKQAKKASAPAAPEGGGNWGEPFGAGRFRAAKTEVKIGGLLSTLREVTTKKGSKMAFGLLEDLKGKVEVVFFPDAYVAVQEILKRAIVEAEPVIVSGEVEFGDEAPKVLVKSLEWAAEAHRGKVQNLVIHLVPSEITPDQLRELKKQLLQGRGKCPVRIDFVDPTFNIKMTLPKTLSVAPTPQTIQAINRIFSKDVVNLH
jgi:DNA polymerase-3 subunit alpha